MRNPLNLPISHLDFRPSSPKIIQIPHSEQPPSSKSINEKPPPPPTNPFPTDRARAITAVKSLYTLSTPQPGPLPRISIPFLPPPDPRSRIQALIALQTPSGSWPWTPALFALVGVDEGMLHNCVPPCRDPRGEAEMWATALGVAFLEGEMAGWKGMWEWEGEMEKAKEFVMEETTCALVMHTVIRVARGWLEGVGV